MTMASEKEPGMRLARRRSDGQQGQMIVVFALILTVLLGFAALVVDVGVLRRANQELWSAIDAGALAGASQLPANGTNANTLANAIHPEELRRAADQATSP